MFLKLYFKHLDIITYYPYSNLYRYNLHWDGDMTRFIIQPHVFFRKFHSCLNLSVKPKLESKDPNIKLFRDLRLKSENTRDGDNFLRKICDGNT